MKKVNILLAAAAAVLTFNQSQADAPRFLAASQENGALLASPRYLEEHPELLRARFSSRESRAPNADRVSEAAKNAALANSPRFREKYPERFNLASGKQSIARNVNTNDRLRKPSENSALAASPRFREEHPELQRGEPIFEIAPLK